MNRAFKKKRYVAVVPVRGGSKGLPNKNILCLNGKPLYKHAVLQGIRTVGEVLISTDIQEILSSEQPENSSLCQRPPELARDETPMESVILDLIKTYALQDCTIVLLQATTPLRADSDIRNTISLYEEGDHDLVMTVVERDRSVLKFGFLKGSDFQAVRDPSYCFQNRQNLPAVFAPNGAVYVFSAKEFEKQNGFPTSKIGATEMPNSRSYDIDSPEDFKSIQRTFEC